MKISKEAKTGIVVIATMVAFYGLYNFLKGKNIFSSGETYYVKYNDVSGLAPSKPVSVNGLRIGHVEEISIVDKNQPIHFIVSLKLDRKIDFSKNTIAEIYEPGVMSGSEVRLLLDYSGSPAETGDTLKGTIKASMLDGITEKLEPTKDKLDSVLISLKSTLGKIDQSLDEILDEETRKSLKHSIHGLDATIASFEQTSKSLTATSQDASKLINDNNAQVKATLVSAQQAMDKFSLAADKINNLELEKIIGNLEQTSAKLNTTLDQINSGNGTMGALLNDKELYNNLLQTTQSLDELLADFKKNPNRYVQFSIFGKKQQAVKED